MLPSEMWFKLFSPGVYMADSATTNAAIELVREVNRRLEKDCFHIRMYPDHLLFRDLDASFSGNTYDICERAINIVTMLNEEVGHVA